MKGLFSVIMTPNVEWMLVHCRWHKQPPSKQETLSHCWLNVGPPSMTLSKHWINNLVFAGQHILTWRRVWMVLYWNKTDYLCHSLGFLMYIMKLLLFWNTAYPGPQYSNAAIMNVCVDNWWIMWIMYVHIRILRNINLLWILCKNFSVEIILYCW